MTRFGVRRPTSDAIGPLAFIAAQTKRMRLGSGVMQLAAPCTGGATEKNSLSLPRMGAIGLNWPHRAGQSKGGMDLIAEVAGLDRPSES